MSNFTLLCCADLYGSKVNLEVPFANIPTVQELTRAVETVFEQESTFLRPPGFPLSEVRVSRIQIYDDTYLTWMDLVDSSQLHEYDQLYVFQPQSAWHVDQQKDLPAPRPPHTSPPPGSAGAVGAPLPPPAAGAPPLYAAAPPAGAAYAAAPPPQQQQAYAPPPAGTPVAGQAPPQALSPYAAPAGRAVVPAAGPYQQPTGASRANGERANVPKEQKVQAVFQELDAGSKGYVDYAEYETGFRSRGIDFSTATVQELFAKGDLNRDGRFDWSEWVQWADLYPNTLEVMYYRGRDTAAEEGLKQERQQLVDAVERNRQRDADLRRQIDECAREAQQIQQQQGDLERRASESTNRRSLLEQQERDLLEQEIKLERQKDQLRASQHRFHEVASTFDTAANAQGSPRRAANDPMYQFR